MVEDKLKPGFYPVNIKEGVENRDFQKIKKFYYHGINFDFSAPSSTFSDQMDTLLIFAIKDICRVDQFLKEDLKMIKLLLELGVDVDETGFYFSWTPLMHAVRRGHRDLVKLLIRSGADIDKICFMKTSDSPNARVTAYSLSEKLGTKGISAIIEKEARRLGELDD